MMAAPAQSINLSTNGSRSNNNNGNNSDAASSSSTSGTTTTDCSSSKSSPQKYLTNCKSLYSCIYCRTHLANHDELVSRSFQGNHGRAYLFNSLVNVSCGPAVQRGLNTGLHSVADVHCSSCHTTLGWKYEKAYVESQKYKEGKYIIELAHVVRENRHLEFDKGELFLERNRKGFGGGGGCGKYQGHLYGSKLWPGSPQNNPNCHLLQCGTNNNNNTRNHRSSLTPPSVNGQWSSSSSANGGTSNEEVATPDGSGNHHYDYDDDEELMFPFYDDMCSNRSSYPSGLSPSQHNRMRRSLYLDSTPYDWKYATSTSSADKSNADEASTSTSGYTTELDQSNGQATKLKSTTATTKGAYLASSLDDSDLSPPSTSSLSSNASPEHNEMSHHNDNESSTNFNDGNKYRVSGSSSNSSSSSNCGSSNSRNNSEHHEQETDNNDDMQFKFEADRPDLSVNNINDSNGSTHEQINKHCDQLNSDTKILERGTEQRHPPVVVAAVSSSSSDRNSSEIGHEGSRDQVQSSSSLSTPPTTAGATSGHQNSTDETDSNRGNSISLEDEEFYDCYTDHEVSNLMIESGSTSTLGS